MTEDIPDDIMKTARETSALVASAIKSAVRKRGASADEVAVECANIIARAIDAERKKWDGASTFNRCMEK